MKRLDLLDALKRVSIFVEQKSRRTFFGLSAGALVLSSEESEIGTAREELPCLYEGPEATIALNYKYVEDPLKVMQSEDIFIEFTEPNRAITISPDPSSNYFHIVMPMQLE
jgi:DNA polymerase-3 subunit beta